MLFFLSWASASDSEARRWGSYLLSSCLRLSEAAVRFVLLVLLDLGLSGLLVLALNELDAFLELLDDGLALGLLFLLRLLRLADLFLVALLEAGEEVVEHRLLLGHFLALGLACIHLRAEGASAAPVLPRGLVLLGEVFQQFAQLLEGLFVGIFGLDCLLLELLL